MQKLEGVSGLQQKSANILPSQNGRNGIEKVAQDEKVNHLLLVSHPPHNLLVHIQNRQGRHGEGCDKVRVALPVLYPLVAGLFCGRLYSIAQPILCLTSEEDSPLGLYWIQT